MKKVLLAAAVVLTLAGCGKTGNQDAEADKNVSMFRTEEVVAKKQLSLPDSLNFYGKDAKVFTETTVSVCWPETLGGKEPKELQDSILSIAFGTNKRATLKESLEAMLAEPLGFEGEKGITQKDVDKLPELSETVHRHSAQLTVTPTSIGKRLVTYSVYSYAFLGGAHGNYATTYVNYDVEKGQVLTVGRVFADVQGLKTAIMRELQLKPEYAGSLLVDKVPTVGNFYIEGALITFFYNPYDVACYAAGDIRVALPIHEVREFMSDYGKSLFPEED